MKNTYKYLIYTAIMPVFLFVSCLQDTVRDASKVLTITYESGSVLIDNPMQDFGVSINAIGADVVFNSVYSGKDLELKLKGSTTNGSLKIYSNRSLKLVLDNVTISSLNGPAINNQSRKHLFVESTAGSQNLLKDGLTYEAPITVNGVSEKQSAAFFSEGDLSFQGAGLLTIIAQGAEQHALASDDGIEILGAHLIIESSKKDGIHCNDGFIFQDGEVSINAVGDGISCDSTLDVFKGVLAIQTSGNQAKGLKSNHAINLRGGSIHITCNGGVELVADSLVADRFNPSYSTGIKSATTVLVDGAAIVIQHNGVAGKGVSVKEDFTLLSGSVNIETIGDGGLFVNNLGVMDSYTATCLSSDSTIHLFGGRFDGASTGIGGKAISADGSIYIGTPTSSPKVNLTTSGQSVLMATSSMAKAKVMKADGSIHMENGTVLLDAAGMGEALETGSSFYMKGGTLVAQGTANGTEVKTIDCKSVFSITGGFLIASGPYRLSPALPTDSCTTQNYIFGRRLTNVSFIPADTCLTIQNTNAKTLFSFKPKRNAHSFLFSSPDFLGQSTYKFYLGGTLTGGTSLNGLYLDALFSPGSFNRTINPNETSPRRNVYF